MPSRLARKLAACEFVITAEVAPPRGCDPSGFLRAAACVAPWVDVVNVTDNQGANMRMTPLVAAGMLLREGIEPVMQLTCRDRNRLALQSDLLGAATMGIRNILALTGDGIGCGDHRQGRAVFDLDSVLLLQAIGAMNQGMDMNGAPLAGASDFFAGTAAAPEAEPFAATRPKLVKKAAAGARFFQTQAVFDPRRLAAFCDTVRPLGVQVIAGILVMKSAKMAEFINRNIPGLKVPHEVIERLKGAADPSAEGVRIAVETALQCSAICNGIHIMAMGRDEVVPQIVAAVR
ncbi:MAG: methylenetetrahydrofolate reductase [Deltaproteobacteria bacterium]|nr:methylenetetrahydrofolate reductase [Deltaproteobacteria bacterium]